MGSESHSYGGNSIQFQILAQRMIMQRMHEFLLIASECRLMYLKKRYGNCRYPRDLFSLWSFLTLSIIKQQVGYKLWYLIITFGNVEHNNINCLGIIRDDNREWRYHKGAYITRIILS